MIQELLNTIYAGIDLDRVWRRTERIWKSDHWMTASAWRRTAEYVAAELEADGLADVEIFECPADGESEFFGHKVWPVWEVRDAKLETIGKRPQVLAHYKRNPRGLLTYSSPTPKGGIETELVMVEDGRKRQHYRGLDVKGKIVFTRQHGGEVSAMAAKMGAVGVLSDFLVNRDSQYLHWMPALTRRELVPDPPNWDTYMQWMHVFAHEAGMFGFALSPAEGEKLRQQLKKGRVRVRATVDAEFSKGTYPAVTGVVPGTTKRGDQVMVLSHLFEHGANDNASGCASSMEVASSLSGLIKRGTLARPKRGIRVLYMLEMQGTWCYLHHHKEQIAKTLAALCLDNVGDLQHVAQTAFQISQNPEDRPSFVDAVLDWLAHEWLDKNDRAFAWITAPY
ncbi:MAG: M28 family peptidase, partial [Armatimonadetes bacterium]|nr:M28 family peptidase [Armatimonadota bacterium]